MVSEPYVPLEKLNSTYLNKMVVCEGVVTKLSPVYQDENYGFIQSVHVQGLKDDHKKFGIHHEKEVILTESTNGFPSLGDKIQITGTLEINNVQNGKTMNMILVAKDIKIINENIEITRQDISEIKLFALNPSIQSILADYIFQDDIFINDDIKLIGTLLLACNIVPHLVTNKISCYLSLLIVGGSKTSKSSFLKILNNFFPNNTIQFSQKSEERFVQYNSRDKKGGKHIEKAGLTEFATNGMILIDNLTEMKPYRLTKLYEEFDEILRKSSIIAAANTGDNKWYDDISHKSRSVYDNLKFQHKNKILSKFDLVLISTNKKINDIKGTRESLKNIKRDFLRKYIIYSKRTYDPKLSKPAIAYIKEFTNEMESINNEKNKERKMEGFPLTRMIFILSRAYARIALKNEIIMRDVQKIAEICKKSLENLDLI
ncbi:MAG: hypothetical protein ACFFCV_17280 [Promethearchaeota archaeon]